MNKLNIVPSFQKAIAIVSQPFKRKPIISLLVDIELFDKNGKVTKKIHRECHSYVRQLIDILNSAMQLSTINVKETNGSSANVAYNNASLVVNAGVGVNAYGIIVGTGNTSVTISDYVLDTTPANIIANGSSSGQLNYGAVSVGVVVIVGSSAKFTIARTFTNNSGADITVNEVCLASIMQGIGYYFMIERTLLTFTISNSTSGTVTYTISITI